MNYIFTFLKINIFLLNTQRFHTNYSNHFLSFYKYFYFFQLTRLFQKINLSLSGNYINNMKKSVIFYNFKLLSNFLIKQKYCPLLLPIDNTWVYNTYYLSIKVANYQINKNFYKNTFFYLLLHLSQLWYPHPFYLKFYLNFFFVWYGTQMYKFYNGFFFKIYNF